MIKFDEENDEMIFNTPKENIMVIDADCQGLLNLSKVGDRFQKEYPLSYEKYLDECLFGGTPGEYLLCEERGHKIAIIFTSLNRMGRVKDDAETVLRFTEKAITKLSTNFPKEKFSSGIMNRHLPIFGHINIFINGLDLDWTVHRN